MPSSRVGIAAGGATVIEMSPVATGKGAASTPAAFLEPPATASDHHPGCYPSSTGQNGCLASRFEGRMLKVGAKGGGFFGDFLPHLFTYQPSLLQPCAAPFVSPDLTVTPSFPRTPSFPPPPHARRRPFDWLACVQIGVASTCTIDGRA